MPHSHCHCQEQTGSWAIVGGFQKGLRGCHMSCMVSRQQFQPTIPLRFVRPQAAVLRPGPGSWGHVGT